MVSTQENSQSGLNTELMVAREWGVPAPRPDQARILVVDDDPAVRETLTLLLDSAGYSTAAAQSAFEALEQIKKQAPQLLLCDLEMPNMSGFELLAIVRSRFPQVAVIAMSGSFTGDVPEGAMADAFYSKGRMTPRDLFRLVAGIFAAASAPGSRAQERPLVWSHWISRDTGGKSFVLVNCTECLRSFPVAMSVSLGRTVCATQCPFCRSEVRYIAEQYSADHSFSAVFSAAFMAPLEPQKKREQ